MGGRGKMAWRRGGGGTESVAHGVETRAAATHCQPVSASGFCEQTDRDSMTGGEL